MSSTGRRTAVVQRGFAVAKGWKTKGVNIPQRQTTNAAGYDFECAEEVVIPSIWTQIISKLMFRTPWDKKDSTDMEKGITPVLVHTGVKSFMGEDEGLFLYTRSSNPLKNFLLLGNGVGVVDSDYFENPKNDGEIMFQFLNFGIKPKTIKKGDRIGQGVFKNFLKADNNIPVDQQRKGGHGSTNEKN